jgi:DUF971 family protein
MGDLRATTPKELGVAADGGSLRIVWLDGHVTQIPLLALRRACPCATCQHEREQGRAGGAAEGRSGAEPTKASPLRVIRGPSLSDLGIARTDPVGRYAVQVLWTDGHSTGIYSFDFLRSLCQCPACRGGPEAETRTSTASD